MSHFHSTSLVLSKRNTHTDIHKHTHRHPHSNITECHQDLLEKEFTLLGPPPGQGCPSPLLLSTHLSASPPEAAFPHPCTSAIGQPHAPSGPRCLFVMSLCLLVRLGAGTILLHETGILTSGGSQSLKSDVDLISQTSLRLSQIPTLDFGSFSCFRTEWGYICCQREGAIAASTGGGCSHP